MLEYILDPSKAPKSIDPDIIDPEQIAAMKGFEQDAIKAAEERAFERELKGHREKFRGKTGIDLYQWEKEFEVQHAAGVYRRDLEGRRAQTRAETRARVKAERERELEQRERASVERASRLGLEVKEWR